jgi:hypothetical protein
MVRTFIILFASVSLVLVILTLSIPFGSAEPHEEMDELSRRFNSEPTPKHLRKLLRYPAQSAASYYHMALVGAAFAKHPEIFRVVADGPTDKEELQSLSTLATYGIDVFQYYPDLKPPDFGSVFQEAAWLARFRGDLAPKEDE